MTTLASGVGYVDLDFLGIPEIIATAVVEGPAGVALIDPGPSTTLGNLRSALDRKGISVKDVRQILVTHIHLDHAGAVGTLVRENPGIEVFVHERGARHMIDPAKLLASAERLYGADMDRLWGEFLPVPEGRIRALQGEERITVGGRDLQVAYTPGHASHHVSYFDPASRVAFVGDTAGIRRGSGLCVMPPTPPPDVDLEAWQVSADRILAWDPDTLFLTHFGPFHGARLHFTDLADRLALWSRLVQRLLADPALDDGGRLQAFVREAMLELRRKVGEVETEKYSRAGRLDYSWQGLARYWTKKSV
ncbi:MAG: MBL fold metallo-hydrolase [Acidobacteriota bacterium]|nr:MBL fold metallo-hydrolase [Acidobacteriota bacterium]